MRCFQSSILFLPRFFLPLHPAVWQHSPEKKMFSIIHFSLFKFRISYIEWVKVTQLCLFATPWTQSMEFSRSEYWSGWSFPSPGLLPHPGIVPRSTALQVDSLLAEPLGSPRILEWVAYPFFTGPSWTRNWAGISCTAGGFFTSWATKEAQVTLNWL